MRLVFMGTPEFSLPFLTSLHSGPHEVCAVVTRPDKAKGRSSRLMPPPVKELAHSLGIPIFQPAKLRDSDFLLEISELRPDLFVVVAFSILPPELLAIPVRGSVNVHGSLLPKYRGAAPVQWAVVHGEKETGVTVFLLDEKMDHGPVIVRKVCPILPEETAGDVFHKLEKLGVEALDSALALLDSDDFEPLAQDHSLACGAPKLKKENGKINWNQKSSNILNRIRAFQPYPVCFTFLEGKSIRIHKAAFAVSAPDFECSVGELVKYGKEILVRTGDGWIRLEVVQFEGKKKAAATDFWNGLRVRKALCFRDDP